MSTLTIKNLHAEVEGKEILKGIDLVVNEGETIALLGPNGHGKSTLLNVIMGHPKYKVTEGSIYFDDKNLLELTTDERAKLGLFLGMQNPSEIPGVINSDFLRAAVNARSEKPISTYQFYKLLDGATKELKMPFDLATRSLNEGFSGGEKKRNEILQLVLLKPKIAMLDEIDSGLDVDAIQIVADVINEQKKEGRGGKRRRDDRRGRRDGERRPRRDDRRNERAEAPKAVNPRVRKAPKEEPKPAEAQAPAVENAEAPAEA